MIENFEKNWSKLLDVNKTSMPYEFIDIFKTISEPYSGLKKLKPNDRRNILLDLQESLVIECDLTNECDSDNIRNFCHSIAFDILDKHKNSPDEIICTISSLKTKN